MRSLYEIGNELTELERFIESLDGDISDPAAEARVTAWLASIGDAQAVKVDAYIALIHKWDNEAAGAKAEVEQYQKIAQVRCKRVEALKRRLFQHMEVTKQDRIETATGRTVVIQANGGSVPVILDPNVLPIQVPEEYQRWTAAINTELVRIHLEGGVELKFAKLGQRGRGLRIR